MVVLRDIDQLDTGLPREIRVQAEYVDREGHFVGDALTGAVSVGEQLQVLDTVVLPVSVDVVNGFPLHQGAPERLFHNPAVLKNLTLLSSSNVRGDGQPDVAIALDMSADLTGREPVGGALLLRSDPAGLIAKFLLGVYASSGLSSVASRCSAVCANERGLGVGLFPLRDPKAGGGTVSRVVTEFLSICGQVSLHHRKFLTAFGAGKRDPYPAGAGKRFVKSVGCPTLEAAILAAQSGLAWVAVKIVSAVCADHFERHENFSWCDDQDIRALLGIPQIKSA
jgi:hypothetical protein